MYLAGQLHDTRPEIVGALLDGTEPALRLVHVAVQVFDARLQLGQSFVEEIVLRPDALILVPGLVQGREAVLVLGTHRLQLPAHVLAHVRHSLDPGRPLLGPTARLLTNRL